MKNIKAARVRMGLSQSALAKRLGVSRSAVWQWEQTGRAPEEHMAKLDQMLGEVDPTARAPETPLPRTDTDILGSIQKLRTGAGLTQAELGRRLGVSTGAIWQWEQKGRAPDKYAPKLYQILRAEEPAGPTKEARPLATWLTKTRAKKGWSVPELSRKVGLTAPAVYRIESGVTRNLRSETRRKLENVLGAIPDDTARELAREAQVAGLGTLEDFDPHKVSELPDEPGIYVLYDVSDRPVYVGRAKNVKQRIKQHEDKFWFKRPIVENASWIRVDDGTLRGQIETLLIKFLKSNAIINSQNVLREDEGES